MAGRIREVLSNRRSRRFVGVGSAVVLASTLGVISYVSAAPIPGPNSLFVPVSPERILDTRPAPDGPIGVPSAAPLVGNNGACTPTELQITGATTGVPTTATAVVLNVTVTRPDKDSVLTVWPTGLPMPRVSNMNWVINRTIANLVTVQLGSGGKVSFCNYNGNVDVIADIAGYYVQSTGGPFDSTLYYSKAELDGSGAPGRYTKAQTDALLAAKADAAATTAALALKADASALTTTDGNVTALTTTVGGHSTTLGTHTTQIAAAASAREQVSVAGTGSATTITASCPGAKRVLGGGWTGATVAPINSGPNAGGTSWSVEFAVAADTATVTAYVICATSST